MSLVKNNRGFGLIEIMIAVFVLSVGLLGLARLQATSLKSNQDAQSRTQASILASDLFDYMRANQVGAEAGSYILAETGDPPTTPTSTADFDLQLWFNNLDAALPNSDAVIACTDSDPADTMPCSTGSMYAIEVIWDEFEYQANQQRALTENRFSFEGTL